MEIELVAESINTNEQTLNAVRMVFKNLCRTLEFDESNIIKIVFADDLNYGNEIQKINPHENYTNTKDHIGCGKTISLENGKSVIILNILFFSMIIQMINNNDFISYPNRLYFHLITHEIGHCIQNAKQEYQKIGEYNDLANPSTVSNYYFSILLNEYMANRNIASTYNEYDVTTELKTFYLDDLIKFANRHYTEDLNKSDRISTFWIFHIQFAKIAAFIIDYPIEYFEDTLEKIHINFNYKDILELYKDYSISSISTEVLFKNMLLNI